MRDVAVGGLGDGSEAVLGDFGGQVDVTAVRDVPAERMQEPQRPVNRVYSSVPTSAVLASVPSETVPAARSSTERPSSARPVRRKSPSWKVNRSRDHSPNQPDRNGLDQDRARAHVRLRNLLVADRPGNPTAFIAYTPRQPRAAG